MHTTQTIREAMTSSPTTVEPGTTAREAAGLMKSKDVGSLPVVEDDRLVGVITDRDLALRLVGEGKSADTQGVAARKTASSVARIGEGEHNRPPGDGRASHLPQE